jgi:hypothetical protein
MVVKSDPLPALYEADEVAWLDEMVRRLQKGMLDGLDYGNLTEYLRDMAKRDKREVESRLEVLIAHWLKWQYQSEMRTSSWRETIIVQANSLRREFESRTLRNHAAAVLENVYQSAAHAAEGATGLPEETFPAECPFTLDGLLATDEVRRYRKPPPPRRGRRKK